MKFVFLLEDDPKFAKEISTALLKADPKVQIRQFEQLEKFANWVKMLMISGPKAVAAGGMPPAGIRMEPVPEETMGKLALVISKVEFLGARQLGLMKKTRELFIKRQICTPEDPTAFVLTAFEDPEFKITDLKDRILTNILMKPFDPLILEQHLAFALEGRHPPSHVTINPYKTKAKIEILKTVEVEYLSPIGFTTKSNRELPPNAIAKYYAPIFTSERHRSVFARMVRCTPHPSNPSEFQTTFMYFAADPTQISNLRRYVLNDKANHTDSPLTAVPKAEQKKVRVVFIEDRKEVFQSIEPTIKRKIGGVEILHFKSTAEFLFEVDPELNPDKQTTKAFGDPASFNLTIDQRTLMTEFEPSEFKVGGVTVPVGTLLSQRIREADVVDLQSYLQKPFGEKILMWRYQDKTFVLKLIHLEKSRFRIEEASENERKEFIRKSSQLAAGYDFLFVSHRFAGPDRAEFWKEIFAKVRALKGKGKFKNFLVAATDYSDEDEVTLSQVFDDIYFVPLDRVYILKRMIFELPQLELLEDPLPIFSIPWKEKIKAVRPVEIEELSEAGLVMKYDRLMSPGSFREVVLWQPYELDAIELHASCNFAESIDEKTARLHFVFFGVKDTQLKSIRSWILENYVLNKQKEG